MKKRVAIVGATGMAGQQFVLGLDNHPDFEVTVMVTSRNVPTYEEALRESTGASRWSLSAPIPDSMAKIPVLSSDDFDPESVDLIFSAIESDLSKVLEHRFAKTTPVVSTAAGFRYEEDTPLIIPGVNDNHMYLLRKQQNNRGWKGFVAPIPNCSATGLATTLKPLHEAFGVKSVLLVTLQAVSGAGRSPGVRALDVIDNVIPYIPKEEQKIVVEVPKILGNYNEDTSRVELANITLNAICTRVAVLDGHTEAVFVGLNELASVTDVKAVFSNYNPLKELGLYSAAPQLIQVTEDPYRPQPRLDRDVNDGMTTVVGRVEEEPVLGGVKYVLVSHNTKVGAAKGAILLAESLQNGGLI